MLTTTEAAKLLGVAPVTVRAWAAAGKIPSTRMRNTYFLEESVVRAFQRPQTGRPRRGQERRADRDRPQGTPA